MITFLAIVSFLAAFVCNTYGVSAAAEASVNRDQLGQGAELTTIAAIMAICAVALYIVAFLAAMEAFSS
jgi:hypothetical protein